MALPQQQSAGRLNWTACESSIITLYFIWRERNKCKRTAIPPLNCTPIPTILIIPFHILKNALEFSYGAKLRKSVISQAFFCLISFLLHFFWKGGKINLWVKPSLRQALQRVSQRSQKNKQHNFISTHCGSAEPLVKIMHVGSQGRCNQWREMWKTIRLLPPHWCHLWRHSDFAIELLRV